MKSSKLGGAPQSPWQRYGLMLALYSAITIVAIAVFNLPIANDYVGADNDDVMRLIGVRDLLAGQGWFDLMQYRLGLEGGTLMHWSRLVDLPIAALILFFRLFVAPIEAEALALAVWPLILVLPMLAAMGLAGRRVGGSKAMHVAFGLTALLVFTGNRFLPGSIDHHNVQLVLIATMVAMLVDARHRAASLAIAGMAAALAIAIGAETTPLVVAVCAIVALTWALLGQTYAVAARAFALSLTIAISLLFFVTVPPHLYPVVTCDSLSIGYYGLSSIGGLLLLVSTIVASRQGLAVRLGVLGIDAILIVSAALFLAPECLGSPLADLDPMLVSLWLDNVTEAQSVLDELRIEPGVFGGYYVAGFFAITICLFRLARRDRTWLHATLLPLLLVAWGVALVQVRGAVFANLLSIVPLSLLISQLQANANRDPENLSAGFAFLVTGLVSVPNFWAFAGVMTTEGTAGLINRLRAAPPQEAGPSRDCTSAAALEQLGALPPTTVAAPSDSGVHILRFTGHRVLAAPYHRNQGGMLTELHIGLSKPDEAPAFLRGAGVGLIAFCPTDGQTMRLIEMKPDGLYAALKRGEIPAYLKPLPPRPNSGFTVYEVSLPEG